MSKLKASCNLRLDCTSPAVHRTGCEGMRAERERNRTGVVIEPDPVITVDPEALRRSSEEAPGYVVEYGKAEKRWLTWRVVEPPEVGEVVARNRNREAACRASWEDSDARAS